MVYRNIYYIKQEMDEQSKIYNITASCQKSTYQEEHWINQLKNGKCIILYVTTLFRRGNFEIILNQEERKDILEKKNIILNDYDFFMAEMFDGCDFYIEIQDENNYSVEEINEINSLIYCEYENDYDDEINYQFDEDILENNNWELEDTIYRFTKGCTLQSNV